MAPEMQHGEMVDTMVQEAARRVVAGTAEPGDRLITVLTAYHREQLAAIESLNGNGRRGKMDKAKAYALPVVGGGGVGTLLLIKAAELLRLL